MLEGRTVRLRPFETSDAERCYRWFNDQDVIGNLSAVRYPISLTHEERWLSERPQMSFAAGLFLAIETKDGRHIGTTSLYDVRPEDRKAGLAITIGEKDVWSKGYGTDAIVTLLRFGFGEMNLHRIWLITLDYNERAQACYRKCGFQEEGRLRQHVFRHGRYVDFIQMGILRDEFASLHGAAGAEGGSDA